MRTTFAVGRVDRKTSQWVMVASVTRARKLAQSSDIPSDRGCYPRGPWSLRAWVTGRSEYTH